MADIGMYFGIAFVLLVVLGIIFRLSNKKREDRIIASFFVVVFCALWPVGIVFAVVAAIILGFAWFVGGNPFKE